MYDKLKVSATFSIAFLLSHPSFCLWAKSNNGITLKGFVGKQRYFFEYGEGIIRGLDREIFLNQLIKQLETSKSKIILGSSFVSRFQEDNNPIFNLPVNVGAYSGRISINHKNIFFNGEYATKINDPEGGLINNNYAKSIF